MVDSIVIIGAGQAAAQAVATLRSGGYEGALTIVGEEPYLPYQRPPLSKKFLSGEFDEDRLLFKPAEFYDQQKCTLHLNTRATRIDRKTKTVARSNGDAIAYDKLLIATGSRVRIVPVEGADLDGVHVLRGIDDVNALRGSFKPGAHLAVIGGGYIGLEVAAVARKMGLEVTVVEMGDRCLGRVTSPEISHFFENYHRNHGVTIRTGDGLSAFEGEGGKLKAVHTQSGERIEADCALLGVGILPNVELALEAGIDCENGITVDEYARSSDPDIYAAGDCASLPSGLYGRRIRLESVHNAIEQAKTACNAMLGKLVPYDQVPWFWSDQYDIKLQIAGLSSGYDHVVLRGDPGKHKFAAFYLKDGRLIAVDAINAVPEYMIGRKLIGERAIIAPERLADETIPMKEMA